ncbi:MAG TPA: hypothetical protein VG821_01445 [Rhizomicrobium sp.]|nr:hypothetical protein [Rhizomicrobium sp.]
MSIAPSSAPTPYYPPRRSNGCLWGCLIVILILMLPVVVTGGYAAWFVTQGYRHNPVLRVVGELVRRDGMAQQVLGYGAAVTGVEGNYFSWMPGMSRNGYDVTLEGPKGQGHLAVTAHEGRAGPKLDSAILTGPDGRRYDLLKHQALPGGGDRPDTSI